MTIPTGKKTKTLKNKVTKHKKQNRDAMTSACQVLNFRYFILKKMARYISNA